MGSEIRSQLQQDIVDAMIDSKAIDLEAMSTVMAKFGEAALRQGESFATIINHNAVWNCGNPGVVLRALGVDVAEVAAGQQH